MPHARRDDLIHGRPFLDASCLFNSNTMGDYIIPECLVFSSCCSQSNTKKKNQNYVSLSLLFLQYLSSFIYPFIFGLSMMVVPLLLHHLFIKTLSDQFYTSLVFCSSSATTYLSFILSLLFISFFFPHFAVGEVNNF